MSREALEPVIGQALLDASFRVALLADADQTLSGFKLTTTEKKTLKRLDGETLDALAKFLDDRTRKLHLNSTLSTTLEEVDS
jgi:hypothetical protein